VLAQLQKKYSNDMRVVFRVYPLIGTPERPLHDKAAIAAQAAQAAGMQGKYWEMHDLLFQMQPEWNALTVEQFQEWVTKRAELMGLDGAKFTADMTSVNTVNMIRQAWDEYSALGIPYTPFLLVNGKIWQDNLPLNYDTISMMVNLILLEKKQFTACPPMTIDPLKKYTATLHTSKGDIVIELYPDKAPLAVNSFVFLARNGWFNGIIFHRVVTGFVAQAGDPTGSGFGGPGYAFDNEISDLKFDKIGLVGMANSGAGSNGSQFFITYRPAPELDGSFTIFGYVIAGMDVVNKLAPRDPSSQPNLPPGDVIESVTIDEK
jgi:cyclophilin family peptidyl-prolyl cis-trans isomerase